MPRSLANFPFSRFPALWEDLENEFSELTQDSNNISMYDDGSHIIVEAALPGLELNDINVTLDKDILKISGEKCECEENANKKWFRKAQSSYAFRLTLPAGIDEKSEPLATYKNGILHLSFNKADQTQSKKINIRSA